MSKTYDEMIHTHVTVNLPGDITAVEALAWTVTWQILLHTGERVWFGGGYCHLGHPEVIQVTDGKSKGFDHHGCCIVSVPAEWCVFHTPEEAESIERCRDIDEKLLSYAQ